MVTGEPAVDSRGQARAEREPNGAGSGSGPAGPDRAGPDLSGLDRSGVDGAVDRLGAAGRKAVEDVEDVVVHAEEAGRGRSEVVLPGGRVSEARQVRPTPPALPFSNVQLARLDEALTLASRQTGIRFTVYLGELGPLPQAKAEELHATLGTAAATSVVVAVSPGERVVEVVTGEESAVRLPDGVCKAAVLSMVVSFQRGDLVGGILNGLRVMAEAAGYRR